MYLNYHLKFKIMNKFEFGSEQYNLTNGYRHISLHLTFNNVFLVEYKTLKLKLLLVIVICLFARKYVKYVCRDAYLCHLYVMLWCKMN